MLGTVRERVVMNKRFKWLYPGMGVKRWIVLLTTGIAAVAVGLAVILNTPLLSLVEQRLLGKLQELEWNTFAVGAILLMLGALFVAIAIRFGVRSLISAVNPIDLDTLAEHIYRTRSLDRGPRIVAIGGGTGLSTMLRGLKDFSSNITAIVTVADDGGSSGRIREELGILPPGDVRNTILALADTEPLMEKLFQYRFSWGEGLQGHSFGNLFIAAMTDITGDFELAVREFSKVLAVRGRVLPATLEAVSLGAEYRDGSVAMGESNIPQRDKAIKRVFLDKPDVDALPEALQAIAQADIVILGPGSLYTSIIPNLLVKPIADALAVTPALRIFVCNVVSQPGETDNLTASEYVSALLEHVDYKPILDYVLVNKSRLTDFHFRKLAALGCFPVRIDLPALKNWGVQVKIGDYHDRENLARHDSSALAREIMAIAGQHFKLRGNGNSLNH